METRTRTLHVQFSLNYPDTPVITSFTQEIFLQELLLIIKKVKKLIIKKNYGWYSEGELKTEWKWSASASKILRHDGISCTSHQHMF